MGVEVDTDQMWLKVMFLITGAQTFIHALEQLSNTCKHTTTGMVNCAEFDVLKYGLSWEMWSQFYCLECVEIWTALELMLPKIFTEQIHADFCVPVLQVWQFVVH